MMASNPMCQLSNLFSSLGHQGGINCEVVNVEGVDESVARKCTLSCPEMKGDVELEAQCFVGYGRNKKAAKNDAAVKALKVLEDSPALLNRHQLSLSKAVEKAFSNEVGCIGECMIRSGQCDLV